MIKLSITDKYKRLLSVPKSAIITFLLGLDRPLVREAINRVSLSPDKEVLIDRAIDNSLFYLNHSDVVRVFQVCKATSPDNAQRLYEEHRYKGMKSLYLHECINLDQSISLDIAALNIIISNIEKEYEEKRRYYGFRNLKIRDAEDLRGSSISIMEFSYSYIASFQITNPETEFPELVKDLRMGFIWIHLHDGWVSICARDEAIDLILAEAVQEQLQCTVKRISIPKSVLQQIEQFTSLRRIRHYNPPTGTGRQVTNPKMLNDNLAMAELKERDQYDERLSCGYNETLEDGTTFALGFSNERGKIFFSRDLTVTQMRSWGPLKISQIIGGIRNLRATDPVKLVASASSIVLKRIPVELKQLITEVTEKIISCKMHNVSELPLNKDSLAISNLLRNKVQIIPRVYCAVCDEFSMIHCSSCQSIITKVQNGQLICSNPSCHQEVPLHQVLCSEGHLNTVQSVSDLLHLFPEGNLMKDVIDLIGETGQYFNEDEESFYIRGDRLIFLHAVDGKTVYKIDDFNELAEFLPTSVPEADRNKIFSVLGQFKESYKCPCNIENCADCVENRRHEKCYLRLFGLFDPSFIPAPHHGFEYGDYNRSVILNGAQKQLVVAIKPAKPQKKSLTLRETKLGQDICSQLTQYRHDGTIDIIGICVPRKFSPSFRAALKTDAQRSGKKIIFIEEDDLVRIVYGTMLRRGISLDEI